MSIGVARSYTETVGKFLGTGELISGKLFRHSLQQRVVDGAKSCIAGVARLYAAV